MKNGDDKKRDSVWRNENLWTILVIILVFVAMAVGIFSAVSLVTDHP